MLSLICYGQIGINMSIIIISTRHGLLVSLGISSSLDPEQTGMVSIHLQAVMIDPEEPYSLSLVSLSLCTGAVLLIRILISVIITTTKYVWLCMDREETESLIQDMEIRFIPNEWSLINRRNNNMIVNCAKRHFLWPIETSMGETFIFHSFIVSQHSTIYYDYCTADQWIYLWTDK